MTSHHDSPSPSELLKLVAKHRLLNSINPSRLEALTDQLSWVQLDVGDVLFEEGDTVDAFYFVISGLLEVSFMQEDLDGNPDNDRLVLDQVGPGSTIGEIAILTGGTRTASVNAAEPSGLVKFPKQAFDQFLASDQQVVDELTKTIMPQLYRSQMVKVLPKLFGELDDQTLHDLEAKLTWMHIPRGHVLCRQGDPSNSFFIIISGRMQVLIEDDSGETRRVGEMSPGESVGEMGVFTGDPRSATIVASRDSELLEFSKQEFDELTSQYPQLMRQLLRLLIQRLLGAHREDKAAALSSNILLAPANQAASLDEFAAKLFEAVCSSLDHTTGGLQPCLLLTSRIVDDRLGHEGVAQSEKGDPNDLRLRSWLSEQENKYRVILFQTDPTLNAWTRRCISSSDEVMYVANASATPGASAVVPEVHRQDESHQTRRRRSLVLLHDPGVTRPAGTMRWLQALNFVDKSFDHQITARHFHVRRGMDADCRRVARFLLGHEVGLVLSGGGARGFAHLGCIQAMRELDIPIDMIGGVSMGSLVSAAYAYDAECFDETIEKIRSQLQGALFDFTAPMVSLARGRRFDRRLQGWFQDVRIEDLWLPYFCVSSNLTEAGIVVFESDSLWRAVRASGTLPGLTSPVISDSCLLFDGCLLNNLPMDVMRDRLGSAHVIAVDVVPPHDLRVEVTQVQSPSGWWLLWNRLNPFAANVELPGIVSIIHRAAELGSVYGRQRLIDQQLADLYLQPPVDEIDIADFRMVDEASKIGYESCKQPLAQWWASGETKPAPAQIGRSKSSSRRRN
jgi:CRP-like cAMP-binding protein/predicted acylesterase/phospholipase RssA